MRASPLSAIAVAALLALAGCAGLAGTSETQSTPDVSPNEFTNASDIDPSVFDRHATAMANTSFTLTVERIQKDNRPPPLEKNFTYRNGTSRYLVEPGASQYLERENSSFTGGVNVTYYSNGSTAYRMWQEDNESTVKPTRHWAFNESMNERYLWNGFFGERNTPRSHIAINATYEREGVEWFQDVPVMRYEATGVDALSDRPTEGENASWPQTNFSATLLLDEDGVIRYYQYTFERPPLGTNTMRLTQTYTLSDVGSTGVEEPDWWTNATAGS